MFVIHYGIYMQPVRKKNKWLVYDQIVEEPQVYPLNLDYD